jgi:hypothetical protein
MPLGMYSMESPLLFWTVETEDPENELEVEKAEIWLIKRRKAAKEMDFMVDNVLDSKRDVVA